MTTALVLGPADHGRPLTLEEFEAAQSQNGYQYELIRGKLYVSPLPNAPQGWLEGWLFGKLFLYGQQHPEVFNYISPKARVFLPAEPDETQPEPDLALYQNWPRDIPVEEMSWRDASPFLVVEVLGEGDPNKDLVRNVELYREVPAIREYWILDPREDADHPTLIVYRRRGQRWQRPIRVAGGGAYTTRLLPDFTLVLDAHR